MGLPGMRAVAYLPGDPLKPGVDVGAQVFGGVQVSISLATDFFYKRSHCLTMILVDLIGLVKRQEVEVNTAATVLRRSAVSL